MTVRCVVVICVRNERSHIRSAIVDFVSQGMDVAIIDHESDDRTRDICTEYLGKGVLCIDTLAWLGMYDQTAQLTAKQALLERLDHDWVIHADADEWLQSPIAGESLLEGITRLDKAGFEAINFEEFVFLPNGGGLVEPANCRRDFLDYYFFAPGKTRLMRAWRNHKGLSNIASGGHRLAGASLALADENFVLRHYPVLSQAHAIEKYAGRVFADGDIAKGWHRNRIGLDAARLRLPDQAGLKRLIDCESVAFDRSEPKALHYWDWPQEHGACEVLVCIYTCEAHAGWLTQFHQSELGQFLRGWQGAKVLEVYADPGLARATLDGMRLTVPGEERYTALSIKTQRMIAYCVANFRFRRLLKIDVTTIMTRMDGPEYAGKQPIDSERLIAFLRDSDPQREYNGYFFHARADRDGAESWAQKKGLTIDYGQLFGAGPMPPFYDGKCYLLGRRFAEFVASAGAEAAAEHEQFLPGSEDVMIGRLHSQYLAGEGR